MTTSSAASDPERRPADGAADLHRAIFRSAHAAHRSCAGDEWLMAPCADARTGRPVHPLVWSRRNGAWRRVSVLWVGAAPGNAGGLGSGDLGAHGTRIPFGGDVAGANLDVLLASIGLGRNDTFIVAALNQLPARGGGEPAAAEIAAPVGAYPDSVALLRDTVIACGPSLIVALGNVALRVLAAALTRGHDTPVGAPPRSLPALRLPTLGRLAAAGLRRGERAAWPVGAFPLDDGFRTAWRGAWGRAPDLHVVQLLHPSAQNMSPFAGTATLFHRRMVDTRDALVAAVRTVPGLLPPDPRPPAGGTGGIYGLPEWRARIADRLHRLDELWRLKGV